MDDIIWPPRKLAAPRRTASAKSHHQAETTDSEPEEPAYETPVEPEETAPEPEQEPEPVEETPADEPEPEESDKNPVERPKKTDKKSRWRISFRHMHLSKKQWAIVIVVVLILLVGGAVGARALYNHFRHTPVQAPQPKPVAKKVEPPKPTTEASHLTGLQVPPEANLRPITGIMVENSPDARPQSGLNDAGVVYEAIAEGGITRFLAVFQEARPQYIGPVRSVRPYYLDFLMPYKGSIAHVGGAPQALSDIKSFGIRDLDQFFNSEGYWRISERFAPHNVYTSFDKIDALNAKKGFGGSTFTGFYRKAEAALKTPLTTSINLSISAPIYDVHYDYDAPSNSYKRSEGGQSHVDQKSNTQLSPKVVVALVMNRGIASDGQHTDYSTTGSGHMYVFQDGGVTEGTWTKASRQEQFSFAKADGSILELNPGQTWVSIVDASSDVTYK